MVFDTYTSIIFFTIFTGMSLFVIGFIGMWFLLKMTIEKPIDRFINWFYSKK